MGELTYYKKKRVKARIAKSDMAKELGIEYRKYSAIEKGEMKMPTKLMDKFNEIIYRGATNTIDRLNNEQCVDDFWNEMMERTDDGKCRLIQKCSEFNIPTYSKLAEILGCSNGTISHYLNGDNQPSYDFKNKLYQFFQDEMNVQIPSEKTAYNKPKKKGRPSKNIASGEKKKDKRGCSKQCRDEELIKFYEELDLKGVLSKYGITYNDVAKSLNVHIDTVMRLGNKRTTMPSEKTLRNLKNYLENLETSNTIDYFQVEPIVENETETTVASTNFEDFVVNEIQTKPTKKENPEDIIRLYRAELDDLTNLICIYEEKINEFKIRKNVCEEVLQVIDKIMEE